MGLFGSARATIPDGRPVILTPKTARAIADRTRRLLDGHRFDMTGRSADAPRWWSLADQRLTSVTADDGGLAMFVRRYDENGRDEPISGLGYGPIFTFHANGLTIDRRGDGCNPDHRYEIVISD